MSEKTMTWAGWALSALLVLVLLADAGVSLFAPQIMASEYAATGYQASSAAPLGGIIVICVVLYAIPRTAVLGAILVTAFLGGAIATHFRVGELGSPPQIVCLVLGALAWGGLYLRDARVRALVPLTR